jgi:hypothetical protein
MATMPADVETKPMSVDDVPMVDSTLAVGEDVQFQRKWWRFEKAVWTFFALVLVADLSGLLGRGPLANVERHASDRTFDLKYEKIERANTSSIMTVLPEGASLRDGKFQFFVSDSILKDLGAQRVIPQPVLTTVGNGGVTYVFPATQLPMTVQIELKPSFVGSHHFTVYVPGGQPIRGDVFVLP